MLQSLLHWLRPAASGPRSKRVQCGSAAGLHHMAYTEWGDPKNPKVVVCVYGLTRNGRDFDALAQALAPQFRVICPDVVGRGQSHWLRDSSHYGFPQYVADMLVLLARLDVEQVHWVGTSMGGLIGMFIAQQDSAPISKLVLNDVGPSITGASLRRIGEYVGVVPRFADLAAAESFFRQINAPFGRLTDAQWRELTVSSVRQDTDGQWLLRYDPGIGLPFRSAHLQDVDLWPIYERIACPTLLTRGALSDLLTHDTAQAMTRRGPHAQLVEFEDVGHAPMFLEAAQIAVVRDFLLRPISPLTNQG